MGRDMTFTEYVRDHFPDLGVDSCVAHSGSQHSFTYEGLTLCGVSKFDPFMRRPEHVCPYQRGVYPFQTEDGQILLARCSLEDRIHRET